MILNIYKEGVSMSRYDMYKNKAMDLLQNTRMKLFWILLLINFVINVNTLLSQAYRNNQNFQVISFIISVLLICANLIIYMLFLQLVRNEPLSISSVHLTASKVFTMIFISLLLAVGQFFFMFIVALALQWIPALYSVGVFFVSILIMMVQVIAAFAICDDYQGVFRIFGSSIRFVRAFAKEMFQAAGVYILIALILLILSNTTIDYFINQLGDLSKELDVLATSSNIVFDALKYESTKMLGYGLILFQAIQLVVTSYLCVYMYSVYALLYQDAHDHFFLSDETKPKIVHHGKS